MKGCRKMQDRLMPADRRIDDREQPRHDMARHDIGRDVASIEPAAKTVTNPVDYASDLPDTFKYEHFDRALRAATSRWTMGLSPHATAAAWLNWSAHLTRSPGRQLELAEIAWQNAFKVAQFAVDAMSGSAPEPPFQPRPDDRRFRAPEWQALPYSLYVQSFLAADDYRRHATQRMRGMSRVHAQRVEFMLRQLYDLVAPSNNPWLNPVIRKENKGGVRSQYCSWAGQIPVRRWPQFVRRYCSQDRWFRRRTRPRRNARARRLSKSSDRAHSVRADDQARRR